MPSINSFQAADCLSTHFERISTTEEVFMRQSLRKKGRIDILAEEVYILIQSQVSYKKTKTITNQDNKFDGKWSTNDYI